MVKNQNGSSRLAGNQNKERLSSIWRRSSGLRLLPTPSGWRTLSSEKTEDCFLNHSKDSVGSTASYISYKSTAFESSDAWRGFNNHLLPPDSVWIATKWNLQEDYVARACSNLTNHVPSTDTRTNQEAGSQTLSWLLPDRWRQSPTLLSFVSTRGFSEEKWKNNRNKTLLSKLPTPERELNRKSAT